jgi:hypothetical protein
MPLPYNAKQTQEIDIHDPAGFESTILAIERSQTLALVRAAAGIGIKLVREN